MKCIVASQQNGQIQCWQEGVTRPECNWWMQEEVVLLQIMEINQGGCISMLWIATCPVKTAQQIDKVFIPNNMSTNTKYTFKVSFRLQLNLHSVCPRGTLIIPDTIYCTLIIPFGFLLDGIRTTLHETFMTHTCHSPSAQLFSNVSCLAQLSIDSTVQLSIHHLNRRTMGWNPLDVIVLAVPLQF